MEKFGKEPIKTLLVVPNLEQRDAIKQGIALSNQTYAAEWVESFPQARELFKKNHFHLLVAFYHDGKESLAENLPLFRYCATVGLFTQRETRQSLDLLRMGMTAYLIRDEKDLYYKLLPSVLERALKKYQSSLQNQTRQQMLESLSEAVLQVNPEGRLIYANQAVETVFQYAFPELQGEQWWQKLFLNADDVARCKSQLLLLDREPRSLQDMQMCRQDGSFIWMSWTVRPIAEGAVLVGRDVTKRREDEEELARREDLLNEAGRLARVGGWEFDVQTQGLTWTRETFRIHEWEEEEVPSAKRAALFYPEEARPRFLEAVEQASQTGQEMELELPFVTAKGKKRWVHVLGRPIHKGQEIVALRGVVQDITEKHEARARLEEREQQLIRAQEVAHIGSWRMELESQEVAWSDEMYRILGQEPEKGPVSYEGHREIIHPEDWPVFDQAFQGCAKYGAPFHLTLRIQRPSGEKRVVDARGEALRDEAGRISAIVGTAQDVTEQKQSEEAIQEAANLLETLFNTIPNPIYFKNFEGVYINCNRAFHENVLGLPKEQVVGKTLHQLLPYVPPDLLKTYTEQDQHLLADGGQQQYEAQVKMADGERYPFLFNKAVSRDHNGRPNGIVGVMLNLTEREKMEQALRKSEARYRELAENTPGVVYTLEIDSEENMRFLYLSAGCWELFGLSPEQIMEDANALMSLMSQEDLKKNINKMALCRKNLSRFVAEHAIQRPDGIWKYIRSESLPHRQPNGSTIWHGISIDLTENKLTEDKLSRVAERMRGLHELERAILGVGNIEEISRIALRHLQQLVPCRRCSVDLFDDAQERATIIAVLPDESEYYPSGSQVPVAKFWDKSLLAGEVLYLPDTSSWKAKNPEDPIARMGICSVLSIPLVASDKVVGNLNLGSTRKDGFVEEHQEIAREIGNSLSLAIQQVRLLERSRRDAETRATLLREVNHRVKNNLAAIQGMLSAEKRRAKSELNEKQLAMFDDLAARIQGLSTVHAMLSARQWQDLEMSRLCREIILAGLHSAPQSVQVSVDVAPSEPVWVPSNLAHHIALVVNELVTNSLKHGAAGRKSLRIRLSVKSDGDQVILKYCDNGKGFDKVILEKADCAGNVGLEMIRNIARGNLRGSLELRNEGGACTVLRIPKNKLATPKEENPS